jgi:hypothetical protein
VSFLSLLPVEALDTSSWLEEMQPTDSVTIVVTTHPLMLPASTDILRNAGAHPPPLHAEYT